FQAEDGIRDATVTGVQTCALPISANERDVATAPSRSTGSPACAGDDGATMARDDQEVPTMMDGFTRSEIKTSGARIVTLRGGSRSEERRVGKEGRAQGQPERWQRE